MDSTRNRNAGVYGKVIDLTIRWGVGIADTATIGKASAKQIDLRCTNLLQAGIP